MGSGSSRMGRRPSRARVNRSSSNFFSSLLCGGSSSRDSLQMENYPDEIRMSSAEHCDLITNEIWNPAEESSFLSDTRTGSTSSVAETGASSGSKSATSEGTSAEDGFRNTETSNLQKCLSESKELIAPYQVSDSYSRDEFCRNRSSAEATTSFKDQESSNPVSLNVSANKDAANCIDNSENKGVSQISPNNMHPSSSSSQELGDSRVDGTSVETHMDEATGAFNSDPVSRRSDVPVTHHSLGDESLQEAIPSGLGFLVANREQGQGDESVLHVDVVSISSSISSSSNADTSTREARRNSRRLFWDAFSRRSSRRHLDSPTIVFSTDNNDDLLSHERWLLDFSGDMFDDGIGGDSGYLGSRIHSLNGRRRHSRSEIWERLRGGLDEHGRRTTLCPSGLHPYGICSCESFSTTEETSTRASISRIVMLAEALFEVLDEIHRQPVSLSLSMMSLPAPESVVDAFPIRNHKKEDKVVGSDDVEQCYICLAEYEEGDKIRVLPCHHEYHMACVDKWLKEIHGVCPLCRGDVRQGTNDHSVSCSESSAPNSEIPSI
ncbi:uncharacterized protein LOC8275717 [Ricinus communis]|uniref:Ring finger protein, putative n=1 Tax=Ricinus communis TaxID=3988 RepID=B9T2M9_RICCO|nr:uncharacterized protein LOC8275717 [Ricinus communis]EEF29874.1 ring finger protein, putative [Ricinus communis]|eukprot:XP_002532498.1 uncharacterized protein LOC8275717 [Ricinus communis]